MTDDELQALRERRREQLEEQLTAPETPSEPVEVEGGDHLDELVDRYDVVLIDFHADWCGPCQMLEPIVEDVAANSEAAVAAVDIDAHQPIARRHEVRGVPTLVLYADGSPVDRLVGVQDRATIEERISSELA